MNYYGPYLLVSAVSLLPEWCYFAQLNNEVHFYKKPSRHATKPWQEHAFAANDLYYVYDPTLNSFFCYFLNQQQLYRAPLKDHNNQRIVRLVERPHPTIAHQWSLVHGVYAQDFNILAEHFPVYKNRKRSIPMLPSGSSIEVVSGALYDVHFAHQLLHVKECVIVHDEAAIGSNAAEKTLFLWHDQYNQHWYFHISFFGSILQGQLNNIFDAELINYFNTQPLGLVSFTSEYLRNSVSQIYLGLSLEQQNSLLSALQMYWPNSENQSTELLRTIYRAVLLNEQTVSLAQFSIQQNEYITEAIESLTLFLTPEFLHQFFKNEKVFIASEHKITINELLMFVNYLLLAMAKTCGDTQITNVPQLSETNNIACGALSLEEKKEPLIEDMGHLWLIIVNYPFFSAEQYSDMQLNELTAAIDGILNPTLYQQRYMMLANDLLASFAALDESDTDDVHEFMRASCYLLLRQIRTYCLNELESEVVEARSRILTTILAVTIQKYKSLIMVLNHLRPEHYDLMLAALGDKLDALISTFERLIQTIDQISSFAAYALIQILYAKLPLLVHNYTQFFELLELLAEGHRGFFITALKPKLNNIIENNNQLCAVLLLISKTDYRVLFSSLAVQFIRDLHELEFKKEVFASLSEGQYKQFINALHEQWQQIVTQDIQSVSSTSNTRSANHISSLFSYPSSVLTRRRAEDSDNDYENKRIRNG